MSKNIIFEASIDFLNSDLNFSINQLRKLVLQAIDRWCNVPLTIKKHQERNNMTVDSNLLSIHAERIILQDRINSFSVKIDKGIVYFQFNINSILLIDYDSDISFVSNKSFNEFSNSEKHLFDFIDSFCNELPAKILEEHLEYCFKKMEFTKAPEIKTTFFNSEVN